MAKTKKYLIICKESYTYPMNFIKDELCKKGYGVEAFFIHSSECLFHDKTLLSFKKRNSDILIHTIEDIALEFSKNYKNSSEYIDYDYLDMVEKKYSPELPFNLLFMCSQFFTTQYHYRFYFRDFTEEEKLYWVQLIYKKMEEVISSVKPDKIIDIDIATIGRNVLHQIARYNNIVYSAIEFSRYKSILLPTYTLGRKTDEYFIHAYNENLKNIDKEPDFINEVEEFRSANTVMVEDYKFNATSKKKAQPLFKDLKRLVSSELFLIKEWIKNFKYTGFYREPPIVANYPKSLWFFFIWIIRERYIFSQFSNLFEVPVENEKYVYFPLHLIPESTTLNKSPFHPNELGVIEAISKSLPIAWKLYVKEHGNMIGERPLSFYKRIKRFSNVRLVTMDFYNDPKPWLINSMGVITLSGTSAFEAAMLGKKALLFGNVFFEVMDGIKKVRSFEELPNLIKEFNIPNVDNIKSAAAYVKTVKMLGAEIGMAELMSYSIRAIEKNEEMPESIKKNLHDLTDLLDTIYGDK